MKSEKLRSLKQEIEEEVKNNNIQPTNRLKKLDWVSDFLEYSIEDRELDEQRQLLLKFKQESEKLLKKLL